jgi:hypothetical protein
MPDTNAFSNAEKAKLAALSTDLPTIAITDVTNLEDVLGNKSDVGHPHTSDDISDLKELLLNATDDAAIITALGSATFTDDVATVAGWQRGRFYYDSGMLYVAVQAETVARWQIGSHSTGSTFDPSVVLTRLLSPTEAGATTTAGGDGDPYVTAAVESIGGMTISVNNATPASNVGIKKLSGTNYWEVIGSDTVTLSITSDSAQGAADKGASPFIGPWGWYAVIEFVATIGNDMVIMSAGGNKGIKLETLSSKATIKINSTMLNVIDGTTTTGGVSVSFKNNWVAGQKYLIAACKTSSGTNSAYLGTLAPGATPGKALEHRTTGQSFKDDFDNLDPAIFSIGFKAGTKIYEIGYLAGEFDRNLIENIFNRAVTLVS